MKISVIFLFSIFLLSQINNQSIQFKKKQPNKFNSDRLSSWKQIDREFYYSSQTGNKGKIDLKLKSSLKEFGLIHLLTPSGIHLSSLLLFIFLFLKKSWHKYIYFLLLGLIMPLTGYYSLKRIVIFHIIKCFKISNQYAFILTFIIDLIIGGYAKSPLSFAFSFLCWGVIIFSTGSRFKLVYNLFLAQVIISYFSNLPINLLSLIINPIFTSLFSFLFPIMSINFWILPETSFDFVLQFIFKIFRLLIISLSENTNYLLFIPTSLMLLVPIFHKLSFKNIAIAFLISSSSLGPKMKSLSYSHKKVITPLPSKTERLKVNSTSFDYWDRKCRVNRNTNIKRTICKKKPSKNGGLSI